MLSEYKAAGIIGAIVGALMLAFVIAGCDDGRDITDPPTPAAHLHEPGCGHVPDAGPDADCFVDPLGGAGGCP